MTHSDICTGPLQACKGLSDVVPGISIEFLCFPRAEEPIEDVMSCLFALCTLLDSPSARTHIAEDQVSILIIPVTSGSREAL